MKKKLRFILLLLLFFILINNFLYGVIFAAEIVTLGLPSKNSALTLFSNWKEITEEVSKRSGYQLKIVMVKNHQQLIKKMEAGAIDLGYYSPFFYVEAAKKIDLSPLVMRVKFGSPYYRAGFIVSKDSEINSIKDLKGKKIALTAEADSTSGYYIPLSMLKNNNFDLKKDLKLVFTGKHINVLKSVVYESVAAGAIKLYILDEAANQKFKSQIKIIERSFYLPGSSIAVLNNFDPEKSAKIKAAFLSLATDTKGLEALKAMNFDGFVISNDQLYNPVRDYLQNLD